MVTVAGNPVLSAPSGARLDAAFAGLEFMVSVDRYLNETTRYADVILPPPRIAQSPHYDFALLNFAVHNYARYSRPLVPLGAGEMSEAEVLARLALAVSGQRPQPGLDPLTVVDEIVIAGTLHKAGMAERRGELIGANTTEQRIDMMLRLGPFGDWAATPDGSEWRGKLNLQALLDNPHGIDLGAQEPRLPGVLRTASRRVELAPDEMLADLERLRARMRAEQPEMVLVGRRQLRSNNSWLHNVAPLVGGSNRCTLQIHPDDAVRLGLNGRAVVKSAAGTLTVEVEPTEDIMPGVVSLPHGWGHGDSAQSVARAHAGVNANALTDDSLVDVPSGNAVFNGVPVTLTRA